MTQHYTTQHRIKKRWLSAQETVKQTRDTYGVVRAAKELHIGDRIAEVGSDDVEAKSLWRFVGHLDAVL